MLSLQAVREACSVDSRDRSERQVDDILAFVRDVKFFQTLDSHQQRALCRSAHIETFKTGDVIFYIGDHGQKFYVVLSGSVAVQIPAISQEFQEKQPDSDETKSNPDGLQTVAMLERGMGFGEIALQSGQTRSATLRANDDPCELLVITKESYERFAGQTHRRRIEERIDYINRCPHVDQCLYDGSFGPADVGAMANCLGEQTLCEHHILCKQGSVADQVFFVRSGSLAVFRTIEVDANGRLVDDEDEASLTERAKKARDWSKSMDQAERQARTQRIATPPSTAIVDQRQPLTEQEASSSKYPSSARKRQESPKILSPDADDSEGIQHIIERKLDRHTRRTNPRRQRNRLMLPPINTRSPTPSPVITAAAQAAPVPLGRRKQVLRIGVLGPFQFFGDHQCLEGSRYPISLVSEGAEIYVLSKGDLVRRIPKRLLAAMFQRDESQYFWRDFPTDQMLLDLRRQNDRWQSYRGLVYANSVGQKKGESPLMQGTSFRDNKGPPKRPGKELGRRDLEHFSGTRTHTLTRLWAMERGDYSGAGGIGGSAARTSQTHRGPARQTRQTLPPLAEKDVASGSLSARTFIDFAVEKYWAMRPGLDMDEDEDADEALLLGCIQLD